MCVGCVLCVCACGIDLHLDRFQCVLRLCMCYRRPYRIEFTFCMSCRAGDANLLGLHHVPVMLSCYDVVSCLAHVLLAVRSTTTNG